MVSKLASNDQTKPVELKCSVQNYDWGIKGEASLVGKIYGMNSGNEIEPDKPYAEVKRDHLICTLLLTISSCASCGWVLMLVDLHMLNMPLQHLL